MNPLDVFSPFRAIMRRWNGYHMDRYIGAELDKRYQEHLQDKVATPSKAVIDLTLQTYPTFVQSRGLYASDGPPQLILVTCTDWNPARRDWDQRAIVIASPTP